MTCIVSYPPFWPATDQVNALLWAPVVRGVFSSCETFWKRKVFLIGQINPCSPCRFHLVFFRLVHNEYDPGEFIWDQTLLWASLEVRSLWSRRARRTGAVLGMVSPKSITTKRTGNKINVGNFKKLTRDLNMKWVKEVKSRLLWGWSNQINGNLLLKLCPKNPHQPHFQQNRRPGWNSTLPRCREALEWFTLGMWQNASV